MSERAAGRLRLGLSVPNLTEPRELVDLGVRAERAGWDGFFLWDHAHGSPAMPVPTADPWVVLGALAVQTRSVRLGTTVTAPARRRPQKLARETVTVDRLSGGRCVLGVGLGEPPEEYTAYGDTAERAELAARLDESLEVLTSMWSGERFDHHGEHLTVEDAQFLPPPVQQPRIPIWVSCLYPHTRPLARAARYDGVLLGHLGDDGTMLPVPLDAVRSASPPSRSGGRPTPGPTTSWCSTAGCRTRPSGRPWPMPAPPGSWPPAGSSSCRT